MRSLERKRRRRERADEQERRRLALVERYGADAETRVWLEAMPYAEITARHNAGHLVQPVLPGMRGEG